LPSEDVVLLPPRPVSQGDKVGEPGGKLFRQRMGKSLAIATGNKPGALPAGTAPAPREVFRTLAESETIEDEYSFGEEIYSAGMKGKVLMATRRKDNSEVVIKIRAKHASRPSSERNWRGIMNQLQSMGGSSHVLEIIEIVETPSEFYIVMPKCDGGELFEFLATETEVPEAECKRIIREILIAVGHLHKNNLIHRDIKPENIMFKNELSPGLGGSPMVSPKTVKLIDFDTCLEWSPATPKNRRFVGTPGYIAPEALLGQLSPQSDIWSIGVILYVLMTGEMPWTNSLSIEDGIVDSVGAKNLYNAMKKEVVDWDSEPWPTFTQAADLCKKLLAFELEDRIGTVEEALAHDWLMAEDESGGA